MIESGLTNPLPRGARQARPGDLTAAPLVVPPTYGILVVDDDEGVRRVLAIGLQQQGFAVWPAASGPEALDLYRHHRAAIDVVLLDVRMPAQDGPETLAALQELNPWVRCCFMSGDLGRYTEWELENLGAAAVLQKPVRLTEAAQVLRDLAGQDGEEAGRPVNARQPAAGNGNILRPGSATPPPLTTPRTTSVFSGNNRRTQGR